jgi:hypothetical protein
VALIVVGAGAFYLGTRLRSKQPVAAPSVTPTSSSPTTTPRQTPTGKGEKNPFGVFFNPLAFDVQERVHLAQELGARYFRSYPLLVPTWNGQCSECAIVHQAGLQFVLTVRNTSDIRSPAPGLTDVAGYKKTVGEVLDQYKPALVVAENEENTPGYFTGTAQQYKTELQALCEVAHSKHIPCADGGILSESVAWMVYFHYLDAGQTSQAQSYEQRAFANFQKQRLAQPGGLDQGRMVSDKTLEFVKLFKSAGADYLNFHWYIPDAQALQESVAYLKEVSGLPVVTNELGQRDTDPSVTTGLMDMIVRVKIPIVIWFSSDSRLSMALVDQGGSLRATGGAFEAFIKSHYK